MAGLPPMQALQQALASQRLRVQTPVLEPAHDDTSLPATLRSIAAIGHVTATSVVSTTRHAISSAAATTSQARTAADAAYFVRQASVTRAMSGGSPSWRWSRQHTPRRPHRGAVLSVVAAVTESDRDSGMAAVRRSSREDVTDPPAPIGRRSEHAVHRLGRASAATVVEVSEASDRMLPRRSSAARASAPGTRSRRTLSERSSRAAVVQAFRDEEHAEDEDQTAQLLPSQLHRVSRGAGHALSDEADGQPPAAGWRGRGHPSGRVRPRLGHLVMEAERGEDSSSGDSLTDNPAAPTLTPLVAAAAEAGSHAWSTVYAAFGLAASLLGLQRRSAPLLQNSPLSRPSAAFSSPSMHSRGGSRVRTVLVAGGGEAARTRRPGARGHVVVQASAPEEDGGDLPRRGVRASRGAGGRGARSALAAVLVQPQEPEEGDESDVAPAGPPSRASRSVVGTPTLWQRVTAVLVQQHDAMDPMGRSGEYHAGSQVHGQHRTASQADHGSVSASGAAVRVHGGRVVRRGVLQVQRSEQSAAPVETWASWLSGASSALRATSQSSTRSTAAGFVVQHSSPSVLEANSAADGGSAGLPATGGQASTRAAADTQGRRPRHRPRGLAVAQAEAEDPRPGSQVAGSVRASRRPDTLPAPWRARGPDSAAPRRFVDVLPGDDADADADADCGDSGNEDMGADGVAAVGGSSRRAGDFERLA